MTRLRLRAISGARLLFRSVVLAGALCAGASEAAVTSYTSKAGFDAPRYTQVGSQRLTA
ncbi:MAG: hypothetical protein V4463_15410 [Pseudomonadota bacterium]